MIIALGVMLVTALLLAAAFTAANGDVDVSHRDLSQKQAYFAALAGVQAYEHELQVNPNFWETCKALKTTLPQEGSSSYEVTVLKASQSASACSTSNPFETVIENSGTQANTFRVEARLDETSPQLRPNMEGVAKLDAGQGESGAYVRVQLVLGGRLRLASTS